MADINVDKRQQDERGRGLQRRSQSPWSGSSPFTLMRRLTEDMDRMFSGFGESAGSDIGAWAPPVEIREQDGNLIVFAELPGLNKEDVKVEVSNDALVIQGERKREWDEERGGVHRSERFYGSFHRVIPLPEGAKLDQTRAEFNNGVLEVRVPIPEESRKTRQVPIESGGDRKPLTSKAG